MLPEGKENPLPSRVAMMTDDVQQFAEMPKPVVIVDEEGPGVIRIYWV